ncbi:hypothetical protein [Clostridium sp.]|uniref:hypothetical protein n=1 Tax=Clostridium sp. TaxID=1506 RepID=UPI00261E87E2|nr:hypothetical protein [Clostridium sp.]
MNKKIIGLSIAIGSVMLFTTAFADTAGSSGYDAYKSAIKNTLSAKNLAESAVITVTDNGKVIANVNNTAKLSLENKTTSNVSTVKVGGQTKTIESYKQDGKEIKKSSDSDIYNVLTKEEDKEKAASEPEGKGINPAKIKDGEMLLDALVGNLQNYVSVVNQSDGTKDISAQLSDSQIPALENTVASLLVKRASGGEIEAGRKNDPEELKRIVLQSMPQLVDNIRIDTLNLKAEVNKDNYIVSQVAEVTISGKDAIGTVHEITMNLNMNLSDFNTTTPDKIDLTGKQIK